MQTPKRSNTPQVSTAADIEKVREMMSQTAVLKSQSDSVAEIITKLFEVSDSVDGVALHTRKLTDAVKELSDDMATELEHVAQQKVDAINRLTAAVERIATLLEARSGL